MKHYPHASLAQLLIVLLICLIPLVINRMTYPYQRVRPARIVGSCLGLCLAMLKYVLNRIQL
ncbi:hypothetical protein GGR92_004815 [Spirosoma lacussanchae]|uniref:hypothetical protein n=1 Tax=Spirosoma lacussanchae TaxID=1884249 RepID=UPI001109B3B8|nr:hypothetical protein [Spirosoma lacussanchae]